MTTVSIPALTPRAMVTLGNSHSEPLARLAAKISHGFKLKALPTGRGQLAA